MKGVRSNEAQNILQQMIQKGEKISIEGIVYDIVYDLAYDTVYDIQILIIYDIVYDIVCTVVYNMLPVDFGL